MLKLKESEIMIAFDEDRKKKLAKYIGFLMCNEEILKHMEEDMTFRGLAERTKKTVSFETV